MRVTTSQASGSFNTQTRLWIHIFYILDSKFKAFGQHTWTYFQILPLLTLAFDVNHIKVQSFCCWRLNFTHVYSFVLSLVMVSCTGRALWLQRVYAGVKYHEQIFYTFSCDIWQWMDRRKIFFWQNEQNLYSTSNKNESIEKHFENDKPPVVIL